MSLRDNCAPRSPLRLVGEAAPKGRRNARKHGAYTREQIAHRQRINAFLRDCMRTIREVEESLKDSRT